MLSTYKKRLIKELRMIPEEKMLILDAAKEAVFDINLDIVWQTITDNLPSLITELEKNLPLRRNHNANS